VIPSNDAPAPTHSARMRELLARLFPPTTTTPAERALVDAVLARFLAERHRFSDILECSLSADESGLDLARFSYAFPGLLHNRGAIERCILAWTTALGPAPAAAARRVLQAARSPIVAQLLIGHAHAPRPRTKLYLQFRDDAGPAALDLAHALLGTDRRTDSDPLPLHLLGLDIGPTGLAGAKLYFVAPIRTYPGLPIPLEQPLWIHRLRHPDDRDFIHASELDIACTPTAWSALAAAPALAPHHAARTAFTALATAFKLRPRRLSLGLGETRKFNLYYVLDEPDH
jgi:hypothetical protein